MTKKTQADYDQLIAEIDAVSLQFTGSSFNLADENADAQNVLGGGCAYGSDDWWDNMYRSATMGAGDMAEEFGIDLNKAMGRVIY